MNLALTKIERPRALDFGEIWKLMRIDKLRHSGGKDDGSLGEPRATGFWAGWRRR
jgi:hypothetical protein